MDFSLSEEQQLLQDSVRRFVQDEYGFEQRLGYSKNPEGFSRDNWAKMAEMGLLGIPFSEDEGGFGGTPVEVMIVMEAFGRGLVLEPYISTVVLGGSLLRLGGSQQHRSELLPALIGGELTVAFAYGERQSRYTLHNVETRAQASGNGFVLNGHKGVVLFGDSADKLIVSARTGGGGRDRSGLSLFLVDRSARGISVRGYPTIDGLRAAEITFENVQVGADALTGEQDNALPLIEHVVDLGIAAVCAEAVGAMAALNDVTLEYLKTRKQFGVPIGSFQVLQHRAVEMLMAAEQAKSMSYLATMMASSSDAAERGKAMSAAKVQIGRSGRFVGQQSVQLHGGIAMTMEYKAGHYFKRLTMIDSTFGDADHHLAKFAKQGGSESPQEVAQQAA